MYLSLEKHVADGKLTVSDGRELEQLHFILRDFVVLLQVSGSRFLLLFLSLNCLVQKGKGIS